MTSVVVTMPETQMKYPVFIRWIFDQQFFNEFGGNETLKSHRFRLPGFPVTYYLTIDYHQIDDEDPDISLKLHCYCDYDDVEIEADFKIVAKLFNEKQLQERKTKEIKCIFDDKNTEIECYAVKEWGWYDEEGEIVFSMEGIFTITNLPIIPLSIKVPKINQEMDANNAGKNFSIIAEGQEIRVHKSILQQVSPVFARMFESENWKETIESKIALPFLPFKLAQIAVDAFYGKKYWRDLDKNEYIQLYQFADQYDIIALKNAIKNCIILTPNNVVEYANLCNGSKCEELTKCCIEYLFTCTQYSLPIKDIDKLTNEMKLLIADKVFSSPLLKRKIQDENVTRNDCDSHIENSELPPPQLPDLPTLLRFAPQTVLPKPSPQRPMSSICAPQNVSFTPAVAHNQMIQPKQPLGFQEQFLLWQQQQQNGLLELHHQQSYGQQQNILNKQSLQ